MWLYAEENLSDSQRPRLEELKEANLKTGKAWAMKESLRGLWEYLSVGWAKRFLKKWCSWARRSKLTPMSKVANMLMDHMDNIVTFCRHRETNAVAEGLNSKIMSIKRRACGYSNKEHFQDSDLLLLWRLNLYPEISKTGATR